MKPYTIKQCVSMREHYATQLSEELNEKTKGMHHERVRFLEGEMLYWSGAYHALVREKGGHKV